VTQQACHQRWSNPLQQQDRKRQRQQQQQCKSHNHLEGFKILQLLLMLMLTFLPDPAAAAAAAVPSLQDVLLPLPSGVYNPSLVVYRGSAWLVARSTELKWDDTGMKWIMNRAHLCQLNTGNWSVVRCVGHMCYLLLSQLSCAFCVGCGCDKHGPSYFRGVSRVQRG
jgi:hypothetical protein